MVRTFKIYFQQFSDIYYSVVNYSHHAVHYIPTAYIINRRLYFLTTFTYFAPAPSIINLFSVSEFILFVFKASTYKWDHTAFFFLYLISLSIMPLKVHSCCRSGKASLFLWLNNIPVYIYYSFFNPFIHWWTFWLLPYVGYYE